KEYKTLSLIIASGCNQRKLGVQGEEEFIGRGVSYCATCDAPFFRGKKVAVVGGGNVAAEESLYLTKFADKVYLIHRRGMLRAEKILQERIFKNPKIEVIWKSVVEKIYGEDQIKGIKIKNGDAGEIKDLICSGIFIFVGLEPNTNFLRNVVELDKMGFVNTNENLQTDKKGIFACGDVRKNTLKQVVVACGEGALAAYSAQKYINKVKGFEYK
ncbi:MAG: FAD-dependent oxidoreductase, partial [Candidatus Aerophobetes bacterium]|nr:FAD-dependent oxidoreductase [Candidatus Aerophobetes bacterium]